MPCSRPSMDVSKTNYSRHVNSYLSADVTMSMRVSSRTRTMAIALPMSVIIHGMLLLSVMVFVLADESLNGPLTITSSFLLLTTLKGGSGSLFLATTKVESDEAFLLLSSG